MLVFSNQPDTAYEMCKTIAPDCKNHVIEQYMENEINQHQNIHNTFSSSQRSREFEGSRLHLYENGPYSLNDTENQWESASSSPVFRQYSENFVTSQYITSTDSGIFLFFIYEFKS